MLVRWGCFRSCINMQTSSKTNPSDCIGTALTSTGQLGDSSALQQRYASGSGTMRAMLPLILTLTPTTAWSMLFGTDDDVH